MRLFLSLISLSVALAVGPAAHADSIAAAEQAAPRVDAPTVEEFLKRDAFGDIRISPTGEYLAASVPLEDRTSLVIFRRADMTRTGHVTLPAKTHVSSFTWVNPTRLLFTIGETAGDLERPGSTGELYGVNADGSGQGPALIGFRSAARTVNRGQRTAAFATLIDSLRNEDDFVLVSLASFGSDMTEVVRMNVNTGRHVSVVKAPVRRASFDTDTEGRVRFASGAGSDNRVKTYYRSADGGEWQLINDEAITDIIVTPNGFNRDNTIAYLTQEEPDGPNAVYAFNVANGQRERVLRDDNVDPLGAVFSPVDGSVYAMAFMDAKPRFEFLDETSPFAATLKAIQAGVPDQVIYPQSWSADGRYGVFVGESNRVPGDFYLFDREANKLSYMVSRNSWLKPEHLTETTGVQFTARDGLVINGFLTLPRGSEGKNLPLVINPHGGPFGPYDQWGYETERQILAAHGYAVLQVNFRGSGNYGRAFMRAGYQQWGGSMQDDLTDATKWAIEQGIADPRRICIYGASYGGYASLMAVVKEPTLYACAIGNVGVYDMPLMYESGDIPERRSGENFLREALGQSSLESISPNRQAARIQVPVSLMAGREDVRAPPEHTELMYEALRALGKPVEMKIYDGEGHGNYLPENRVDFANRVLAFLDTHLKGPGRVDVGAPQSQPEASGSGESN